MPTCVSMHTYTLLRRMYIYIKVCLLFKLHYYNAVACPRIRKGGGPENLKVFFVCLFFQFVNGGGGAQKIAEKMILPTKKVAKYR